MNEKLSNILLSVYLYQERPDCYVTYCPSLDLCGAGRNTEEAKESFRIVLPEYFKYTISHGTLAKDLSKHGWQFTDVYT